MNQVRTHENKIKRIFLIALLFCALGCIIVGVFLLDTPYEARAEVQNLNNGTNASLFLPETYDQYLTLKQPTDVAVCDNYIAVADENLIYVYSRERGEYSVYTHGVSKSVTINKIQFSDEGRLYFVNTAMQFYELDLNNMTTEEDNIYSLSTFFISGEKLYAATSTGITQLRQLALDGSDKVESVSPFVDQLSATPCITYADGVLYYTVGNSAYEYDFATRQSHTFILDRNGDGTTQHSISSICAYGNSLYYTNPNGLFVSDKHGNATRLIEGSGCCAVTVYKGMLYCVKEKSIVQYDIEASTFTDYEISSASSSQNRLSGAEDCVRAGDLLVTADTGNNRISVYDLAQNSFETLACEGVQSVATDGAIIAAATSSKISIFEKVLDPETRVKKFSCTNTLDMPNVVGIACVYDVVYCVTSDYHYKKIARGDNADSNWAETSTKQRTGTVPKAITADIFGDIFVADNSGNIYQFSEENFTTADSLGDPVASIGEAFSSLRAGFDGKLYYLDAEKNLCMHDGTEAQTLATIDGSDFVYTGGEKNEKPTSFALGFEDDSVYFLFGDYIVKSKKGTLGLATPWQCSNATDIVRAGNLLVTADTGNRRVTVYDMQKRSFTIIRTDFSPTLVATDGSVIAAASGNKVYVCEDPSRDRTFGEPTTADIGTIKGLACVHGSVYYITEYGYGKVEEVDQGLISRLEDNLAALATDDNGILYVVDSKGYVRYYHDYEFIDTAITSGVDAGISLPMPISSLRTDREGNLYYIHENALWKNNEKLAEFGNDSVQGDESGPVAFALDFESDNVYLLYDDYIVKTKQETLGIPPRNQSSSFGNRQDILLPDTHRKRR